MQAYQMQHTSSHVRLHLQLVPCLRQVCPSDEDPKLLQFLTSENRNF